MQLRMMALICRDAYKRIVTDYPPLALLRGRSSAVQVRLPPNLFMCVDKKQ